MSTVLLTGAGGFIASNLMDYLYEQGHDIIALYHDSFWNIRDLGIEQVRGDICDFPRMLELIVDRECDYVYHLAAKSIVRNCRLDPLGCVKTNVLGTATILEACRQSERVKGVLCAASDKAFGSGPVPYREDQALRPTAIYEASKSCVVHLCATYWAQFNLPCTVVTTANVFGPGDCNRSRLVPNTILRLLRGESPQITAGAEEFRREFVYVGDVCQAYMKLMEAGRWGETFNVGSGECHTVREAVQLICDAYGKPDAMPEVWDRPATLTEIQDQWLCLDKLKEVWPDYKPRTMAETLPGIIEWYRENQ